MENSSSSFFFFVLGFFLGGKGGLGGLTQKKMIGWTELWKCVPSNELCKCFVTFLSDAYFLKAVSKLQASCLLKSTINSN